VAELHDESPLPAKVPAAQRYDADIDVLPVPMQAPVLHALHVVWPVPE